MQENFPLQDDPLPPTPVKPTYPGLQVFQAMVTSLCPDFILVPPNPFFPTFQFTSKMYIRRLPWEEMETYWNLRIKGFPDSPGEVSGRDPRIVRLLFLASICDTDGDPLLHPETDPETNKPKILSYSDDLHEMTKTIPLLLMEHIHHQIELLNGIRKDPELPKN